MPLTFNASLFHNEVKAWMEEVDVQTVRAIREPIKAVNRELIAQWPVKTGLSRGSWFAGIGAVPTGQGSIGAPVLTRLNGIADKLKPGDVYYVSNTAPYAARIEFGFTGADVLGRQYDTRGRFILQGIMSRITQIIETANARFLR